MLVKPKRLEKITTVKYGARTVVYFGEDIKPIFIIHGTVEFPNKNGKIGIVHNEIEFMKQFYSEDVKYNPGKLSLRSDIPFKHGDKGDFLIQFNDYWDYQGKLYASFKVLDFKEEKHMTFEILADHPNLLNEVIS